MDTEQFFKLKSLLIEKMKELRISIDDATQKFTLLYGEDHFVVARLKSYYPALEKQEQYTQELDILLAAGDFQSLAEVSQKIKAISELIKEDAKSLLALMQNSEESLPDDTIFH